jgi:hypothetical protein
MTVCIALFIAALMMAYNRLFDADYRDLVKELQVLLPTASQQVTCEQHIALWAPSSSPPFSTVSEKLREWPHEAYREHIVDMLRVAGASDTELDEARQRLIVRPSLVFRMGSDVWMVDSGMLLCVIVCQTARKVALADRGLRRPSNVMPTPLTTKPVSVYLHNDVCVRRDCRVDVIRTKVSGRA